MDAELAAAIRELAQELRAESPGIQLRQGVIVSVEDWTCTVAVDGDTENPIPGWRWLIDGYGPTVGDVSWILDGGPAARFLIGPSQIPQPYWLHYLQPGVNRVQNIERLMDQTGNHLNWPTSLFSTGTAPSNTIYNLSSNGATYGWISNRMWLQRGIHRVSGMFLHGPNIGRYRMSVLKTDGTVLYNGTNVDGYNAAYSQAAYYPGTDITIPANGHYDVVIEKMGTKNASSTDYYTGFHRGAISMTGLIP